MNDYCIFFAVFSCFDNIIVYLDEHLCCERIAINNFRVWCVGHFFVFIQLRKWVSTHFCTTLGRWLHFHVFCLQSLEIDALSACSWIWVSRVPITIWPGTAVSSSVHVALFHLKLQCLVSFWAQLQKTGDVSSPSCPKARKWKFMNVGFSVGLRFFS